MKFGSRSASSQMFVQMSFAGLLASFALNVQGAESTRVIEEVVVTAQKRQESVQDVPLSVTPITGEMIQRLHINDLKDVTGTMPNVQIQVNAGLTNAASYIIRGIGISGNPSPFVGTAVGTVVDGVVQSVNELGLVDQFDIERIEVLRGPQGTLFGANTTGGVINIITRQPTGEFGVHGQATVGNYDRTDASIAVDFPIVEGVLAGRILAANRSRDGHYTNIYDGEDLGHLDSTMMRGYLLWTPTETLDVTLKADMQKIRNGTDVLLNISYPGQVFYRPDTPYGFKLYSDVPDEHDSDTYAFTLTTNWDSQFGEFTSITNYSDWETSGYQDIDGIDLFGFAQNGITKGWQASQEFRNVFRPTENVEILAGLFGMRWEYDSEGQGWPAFVSPTILSVSFTDQRKTDVSAFTQMYWDVTERLRLQAGVRVSWEEVRLGRSNFTYIQPNGANPALGFGNLVGATMLPVSPINAPSSGEEDWTNVGGKIGLDYRVGENVMLYGYYARGFKSGGFNGRVSRSEDIGPYDPEFVDSYEIGLKSDLLENRLRLNLALFLNQWKDMQVNQVFYEGTPPTAHSAIVNAAEATTQGVELEAELLLLDSMSLRGTVGYLDAEYDDFQIGTGPACPPPTEPQPVPCLKDFGGRDLPYSPEWTGSLTLDYGFRLGAGDGSAIVQYTFNGERWGSFNQAPSEFMKDVGLLNASLSWSPSSTDSWTITAWGRNITNKKYLSLALDAPPIFTEGLLGAPREYGIDFEFRL
ncbi:MAG: TonB-dependent receptor [Pseudomonadales bacterium]